MKILNKKTKTEIVTSFMNKFINTFLQKEGFILQSEFVSALYKHLLEHEECNAFIKKYAISESIFNQFINIYFQKFLEGLKNGNIYRIPYFGYYTIKFYRNSKKKNVVRRARIRRFAKHKDRLTFIYGKSFILPNYSNYQKLMYQVFLNKNGVYTLPEKKTK